MHVLLGILGTVVTILFLLNRLADAGIDLGGLNPFLWKRRRNWRKKYDADPKYKIAHPMDATALLAVAITKSNGEMSSEEKQFVLGLFENEFNLANKDATELLSQSSFLLGRGDDVEGNVHKLLKASQDNFTAEQSHSAIEILQRVADLEGGANEAQQHIVDEAKRCLSQEIKEKGKWD